MSKTVLLNVTLGVLRPGPSLVITQSTEGLTTCSHDFTCRKGDISNPLILAKLVKGSAIAGLIPDIGSKFNFMTVEDWSSRDNPGGYTTVSVNFKGVDTTGEATSSTSVTYTRNNSLSDEPIFANKKFIAAVTRAEMRDWIRGATQGLYERVDSDTIQKTDAAGTDVGSLDTEDEIFWWDWIVTQGNMTYLKATSEWTKSATGRGTLSNAELAKLGYIDTPDGSPAAPDGDTWLYTGATESITVAGDGVNSYSKTWTSGNWPTKVYQKP
jgi:hypothetical protein